MYKHFLLLAFCLLGVTVLFSQTPVFDTKGRLTELPKGNSLAEYDITLLMKDDQKVKKKAQDVLIQKINDAKKIFDFPNYKKSLYRFYTLLWSPAEITTIKSDLTTLQDYFKNQPAIQPAIPVMTSAMNAFSETMMNVSSNVFSATFNPGVPNKITLTQRYPFNEFVIKYYNNTLNDYTSLGLFPEDISDKQSQIETTLQTVSDYLKQIRQGPLYISAYEGIKTFHKNINSTDSVITAQTALFKKDWFTKWFWFRGGELRLNPLDFTTDDFIANNPQYDQPSVEKFNEYMDTIINRQIRYDTTGNADEFIRKLKLKGTGPGIFSFKDRNDLFRKENISRREKLLTTYQVLNKVIIPASDSFANYSAATDIKFTNNFSLLSSPIHTGKQKTIALHNISASVTKADLLETDKSIADRSAFQVGFDTVISQLGELAVLVNKFTPFATGLNLGGISRTAPVNVIHAEMKRANVDSAPSYAASHLKPQTCFKLDLGHLTIDYCDKSFTIKDKLQATLKDSAAFEEDIFEEKFDALKDTTLIFLQSDKGTELRNKYKIHLENYLQTIFKNQATLLLSDSILLNGFLDIYHHSTLPETNPLEPIDPSGQVYYSKILNTKPSDDAIEKNVIIYTLAKDTAVIDKFKFRIGKNYRFLLGGGLAYTLNNYDQSVATESNGSISITNTTRLYQVILGMHIYFGKGLYMQNNGIFRNFWSERLSAFFGVGLPNPLENLYLGLSADAVPGFKINAGLHVIRNNRYTIQNDHIIEESLRYRIGGPYVGITIDPTSLLNLFNAFKKK